MQTNPNATNHQKSALCQTGCLVQKQRKAEVAAACSLSQQFTYGKPLERVDVLTYLGRLLVFDDVDAQAVQSNIRKAQQCWARIICILRAENASPRMCGIFYKAAAQAILLFGSETWNLTSSALKHLKRFHIWAAWRMRCGSTLCPQMRCWRRWGCKASTIIWRCSAIPSPDSSSIAQSLVFAWVWRDYVDPAPASDGGRNRWTWTEQGHWH